MHPIGWLSLPRCCIFSGALKCSVIWAIFCLFVCLSWRVCYFKGWSLRCSPGRGNAGGCAVKLYVGEGRSGSIGARLTLLTLLRISIFHSDTHNQTGSLWCWFPSGWACAHSRPLWVSPRTSPVRLGVSPAAAPTPKGVFNQRFEALFPPCWSPGLCGLLHSPLFLGFICAQIWCRGCYPPLCLPHSAPL